MPAPLQRNMDIFFDKGASHWLTVLPVTSHGFSLPKSAFRDALCMRYNWQPDHLPSHCACGQAFSIDHALSCATGGYSVLRHNELRNFTASVMQEVCHDVALEPPLQPLDGELLPSNANVTKEARLDISARGFWGDRFSRSLFDVRVFHPNAPSAITTSLASQHSKHERSKRRQYEQRVREVEGASFVPLVFSTAGGMGPACTTTFKRLASSRVAHIGSKVRTNPPSFAKFRFFFLFALRARALSCHHTTSLQLKHRNLVERDCQRVHESCALGVATTSTEV